MLNEIITRLKSQANPANVAGMARFGINPAHTLGIGIPYLRKLAREIGKNYPLAMELWETGIHEARILAALIADPRQITETQMDQWVLGFDSWDVCDQVCSNLFDKTPFAYKKAIQWSSRSETFVRRAGFVLMAVLAVHDKQEPDATFEGFFPLIIAQSSDERNFVKKAVNWALRQIGKRNQALRAKAIAIAQEILQQESKSAKWIARDALRELQRVKAAGPVL